MTPEERAAEINRRWSFSAGPDEADIAMLAEAIKAAVAEEREACAKEVERHTECLHPPTSARHDGAFVALTRAAAAIRSRS